MSELLFFTAMTKLLTKAFEEFILAHGLRAQPIIVGKAQRQVRNEEASGAASEVLIQFRADLSR